MTAIWHPDAIRDRQPNNGSYTGGPPKGVLHSTEAQFGHGWAHYQPGTHPHLEIAQLTSGRIALKQFYPLDQPARALRDEPGGARTDRDHAIQVEMGFQAQHVKVVTDQFWAACADLLRWIEDNGGVDPDTWAKFRAYPYVLTNPVRFGRVKWDRFNGWCGHQHVPENSHGDPGAIPVAKLRRSPAVTLPEEEPMYQCYDAGDGRGVFVVTLDGAVHIKNATHLKYLQDEKRVTAKIEKITKKDLNQLLEKEV